MTLDALGRTGMARTLACVVAAPVLLAGCARAGGRSTATAQEASPAARSTNGVPAATMSAHFVPSDACKLVEGAINPQGWCTLFTVKPG